MKLIKLIGIAVCGYLAYQSVMVIVNEPSKINFICEGGCALFYAACTIAIVWSFFKRKKFYSSPEQAAAAAEYYRQQKQFKKYYKQEQRANRKSGLGLAMFCFILSIISFRSITRAMNKGG
jgi:hypothetical protein